MVNLTRIYTRTGDGGETHLSDMSRARKTDPRVEAYGAVDETNATIGLVLAAGGLDDDIVATLRLIQNELFDLGADLSTPLIAEPEFPPLRIEQPSIDRLEGWCDQYNESVPPLRSFILPGGTSAAVHLHLARTVCRRAERQAWAAAETYGTDASQASGAAGGVSSLALTYLNRLSDLLFILCRVANGPQGDVLWVPGGERNVDAPAKHGARRRKTAGE